MRDINTPFLLLRGLTREVRHWGAFIAILQEHFPYTRIITLDIPGNGHLYQETSPMTIAGMTEALRQQLSHLAIAEPVNLIGLSMGGMTAIDWMLRYPKEIQAGVLINTSLGNFSPFYQRMRWQTYARIIRLLWQNRAEKERTYLALTSNREYDNPDLLTVWQSWQQQYPVSPKNAYHQVRACGAFQATQKPSQPLLVLSSLADHLVDYRCSMALHNAWQTTFELHRVAGHDLPLDDPLWVSQQIKNWLASSSQK